MIFEETVSLSHLDRRLRALIKTPGYAKGAVKIYWRDDAVDELEPLHTDHEAACLLREELNNRAHAAFRARSRYNWGGTSLDEHEHLNRPYVLGLRCQCVHRTAGFFATQKIVPRRHIWDGRTFQWTPEVPVVIRFAPRPFSALDALRFGELEPAYALALADELLSRGCALGEAIVMAVRKMRLKK